MPKSTVGTVGRITMVAQTGGKTGDRNEAANGRARPYSVIHVRRDAPEAAASIDDYPSARFINGEFRAQTFNDEALLYALAE